MTDPMIVPMVSPQKPANISPINTGRMLLNSSPTVVKDEKDAPCMSLATQMIVASPNRIPL